MALILREITREIATNLVSELKNDHSLSDSKENGKTTNMWQILLSQIAKEVVRQLKEDENQDVLRDLDIHINGKDTKESLDKAEKKLGKVFGTTNEDKDGNKETPLEERELDDLDDVDLKTIEKLEKKGVRIIYPNLKYRKPKYQNVSEVLKYVESENGKPEGVKLVIMNFND